MKKLFGILAFLAVFTLAGCSSEISNDEVSTDNSKTVDIIDEIEEPIANIANPWTDCPTIQEAEQIAGFEVSYPILDDLGTIAFRAMDGMIEIMYSGEGLPEGQYVTLRKSVGEENNSGDYNEYEITSDIIVNNNINVEAKSYEGDTGIKLAIWTNEGYSYSASFPEASNVEESLLSYIVESLK